MTDTDVAIRAKRRHDLIFVALAVALIVPMVLIVILPLWTSDDPIGETPVRVGVTVLIAVAFPLLMLLPPLWARRRGVRIFQPTLLMGVDRARRKRIASAIRTTSPVPEEDIEIATETAERVVHQRWFTYLIPLCALPALIRFLTGEHDVPGWLGVVGIVIMTAALPLAVKNVQRCRRWLELYGRTTTS